MQNMKRTLAAITLAATATLGLNACGTPTESNIRSAGAETSSSPSASPSAAPVETKKPDAPPAIKGVVTDLNGSYLQTTFDETDPSWELDYDYVPDSEASALSKEELNEAWQFAATFIAEEGIDSTLRTKGSTKDPAAMERWIAENSHKFVDGTRFVSSKEKGGNYFLPLDGLALDEKDYPYTYAYDASAPRVIDRDFQVPSVDVLDDGKSVKFSWVVDYKAAVKATADGAAKVITEAPKFTITVTKVGEQWKISKAEMLRFGGPKYLKDGVKLNLK